MQWKTRTAPAHPKLKVKIVTALAPDAVADIAHRLDRANLLAVPNTADLVDISSAAFVPHSLAAGDLKGYQAALVVTDQDVADRTAAATALTAFAANGHGVVLGGQTHWTSGGTVDGAKRDRRGGRHLGDRRGARWPTSIPPPSRVAC